MLLFLWMLASVIPAMSQNTIFRLNVFLKVAVPDNMGSGLESGISEIIKKKSRIYIRAESSEYKTEAKYIGEKDKLVFLYPFNEHQIKMYGGNTFNFQFTIQTPNVPSQIIYQKNFQVKGDHKEPHDVYLDLPWNEVLESLLIVDSVEVVDEVDPDMADTVILASSPPIVTPPKTNYKALYRVTLRNLRNEEKVNGERKRTIQSLRGDKTKMEEELNTLNAKVDIIETESSERLNKYLSQKRISDSLSHVVRRLSKTPVQPECFCKSFSREDSEARIFVRLQNLDRKEVNLHGGNINVTWQEYEKNGDDPTIRLPFSTTESGINSGYILRVSTTGQKTGIMKVIHEDPVNPAKKIILGVFPMFYGHIECKDKPVAYPDFYHQDASTIRLLIGDEVETIHSQQVISAREGESVLDIKLTTIQNQNKKHDVGLDIYRNDELLFDGMENEKNKGILLYSEKVLFPKGVDHYYLIFQSKRDSDIDLKITTNSIGPPEFVKIRAGKSRIIRVQSSSYASQPGK